MLIEAPIRPLTCSCGNICKRGASCLLYKSFLICRWLHCRARCKINRQQDVIHGWFSWFYCELCCALKTSLEWRTFSWKGWSYRMDAFFLLPRENPHIEPKTFLVWGDIAHWPHHRLTSVQNNTILRTILWCWAIIVFLVRYVSMLTLNFTNHKVQLRSDLVVTKGLELLH